MKHKRQSGFTIIEIAVVISVIAIIASIILVSFNQVQKDSRDRRRTADATALKVAVEAYYRDNNEYPKIPTCNDGASCNSSDLAPFLVPKYIPAIPMDPKGIEYNYVYDRTYNPDAYGFYIQYEGTPGNCKTGRNLSAWWWYAAPCPAHIV